MITMSTLQVCTHSNGDNVITISQDGKDLGIFPTTLGIDMGGPQGLNLNFWERVTFSVEIRVV